MARRATTTGVPGASAPAPSLEQLQGDLAALELRLQSESEALNQQIAERRDAAAAAEQSVAAARAEADAAAAAADEADARAAELRAEAAAARAQLASSRLRAEVLEAWLDPTVLRPERDELERRRDLAASELRALRRPRDCLRCGVEFAPTAEGNPAGACTYHAYVQQHGGCARCASQEAYACCLRCSECSGGCRALSKYQRRAVFRVVSFLLLFGVGAMWHSLSAPAHLEGVPQKGLRGLLEDEDEEADDDDRSVDSAGAVVGYIALLVYMFLALSLVCDEFFVPALEVIVEKLNVSNDVAGATFMAAGGSAPELFTSFIGTFQESNVGFGTIVGSAVFNVLFVIGMCAVFSKEVLELTWWPLARDCTYYALSLLMLAMFFGQISPDEIELWEAAVLLSMYVGYVLVMRSNVQIYHKLMRLMKGPSYDPAAQEADEMNKLFNRQTVFRAGVLQLLTSSKPLVETAGIGLITKIKGDVKQTFARVDKSGDEVIDSAELGILLTELGCNPTEEELNETLSLLDANKDGKITFDEFSDWYADSEARLASEMHATFQKFDTDNSGTVDKGELSAMLSEMGCEASPADIEDAMRQMDKTGDGQIERDEFETWFQKSMFWQLKKADAEENKEAAQGLSLKYPETARERIMYLITMPLVMSLLITLPDVRKPGQATMGKAVWGFLGAIAWIGVYSYIMVDAATIVGDTAGIPIEVMGLTFLAAGTSVPDLLSSVIVAKQGHGDMAVSSSVGSNIFDVLVGLPLPWFFYALVNGKAVAVTADTLFLSIIILLGMLVTVCLTIKACHWQMTKGLGYTMFLLYVLFVVQDLLRSPDLICDGGCI